MYATYIVIMLTILWSGNIATTHDADDAIINDKNLYTDIVSPRLRQRLERQQKLGESATPRMILRLLDIEEPRRNPHVTKRLKKLVNDYHQQVLSMVNLFMVTTIDESTPSSLIEVILFLAQDDPSLFLSYMTFNERVKLARAIKLYHAEAWPANRNTLGLILRILRPAKTVRDMIVRMHGEWESLDTEEGHRLIVATLKKMRDVLYDYTKKEEERQQDGVEESADTCDRADLVEQIELYLTNYATGQWTASGMRDELEAILLQWDEHVLLQVVE